MLLHRSSSLVNVLTGSAAVKKPYATFSSITGNGVDSYGSYYGFANILWLREHQSDVWKKTRYLLPPNAYVI